VVNVHEHPGRHLSTHFPRARRPLMRSYYRRLLPRADKVVVVAAAVGEELVKEFGVPAGLIEVARNPVDASSLRHRAAEPLDRREMPEGSGALLVAVGRLEHVKGFDVLVRALALAAAHPPIRLVLVGDGSERDRLRQLVSSLGLDDVVAMVGYRENPLPYIAAADALVVPSRTEAWPNVVCESLAVGTPVLATRCSGGLVELLGDGRFGELVPADDVDALANGLTSLLADDERLRGLREAGPGRVAEFDGAEMAARYEEILVAASGPRTVR
jgi:glycosyltransferase involved in cell wall biosynthesis